MQQLVRLGILHVQISKGNMHYNHRILGQAIAIAAGYDCEAVLTGELIECGSQFWRKINLKSVPGKIYPYFNYLQEIAYKYKMDILMGRAERDSETGKLYSSYTHINQIGEIAAKCRKQVMENVEESKYLSKGEQLVYTKICGLNAVLFIGYNEKIGKLMKYAKDQKADIVVCAVSPMYHGYLRDEVSSIYTDIQPVIFSSYNMLDDEDYFTGESIYFGGGKGSILRLSGSHVIVVDYDKQSKCFQLVRCVNINEMLQ